MHAGVLASLFVLCVLHMCFLVAVGWVVVAACVVAHALQDCVPKLVQAEAAGRFHVVSFCRVGLKFYEDWLAGATEVDDEGVPQAAVVEAMGIMRGILTYVTTDASETFDSDAIAFAESRSSTHRSATPKVVFVGG